MKALILVISAMTFAAPALAQDWVSLGGNLNSEIDLQSVHRRGNLPVARMRYGGQVAQGTLSMTLELGVMCAEGYAYILDGASSASWILETIPMPDLPEEDRVIWIPSGNEAFNNFFTYLCNR